MSRKELSQEQMPTEQQTHRHALVGLGGSKGTELQIIVTVKVEPYEMAIFSRAKVTRYPRFHVVQFDSY